MYTVVDLRGFYKALCGVEPGEVVPLAGGGSARSYFRIPPPAGSGLPSLVGVIDPEEREAAAFERLGRVFRAAGIGVPAIKGRLGGMIIQEDLGGDDLSKKISMCAPGEGEFSADVVRLCAASLRSLAVMQTVSRQMWQPHVAYPDFGPRLAEWDLNYFKYSFLKPSGVVFDEQKLQDDFDALTARILAFPRPGWGFMYRDFQSRNIMIDYSGYPRFIDFQAGRFGPLLYDAVSMLWQAKAGFSHDFRMRMTGLYADALNALGGLDREQLFEWLPDFVALRVLQTLGAYGFRGLVEHKAHFVESIPAGISNLVDLAQRGWLDAYPELGRVAHALSGEKRFAHSGKSGHLRVKVSSFSYKKGYPENLTGNGGGFMFDCRALHNPGRYERYRQLTGRDRAVVDFLEERGEVQPFLKSVWQLTDNAVDRYRQRGFSDLEIGFGCTGGQHRSVFCADATARHLQQLFPDVEVQLSHREQPQLATIPGQDKPDQPGELNRSGMRAFVLAAGLGTRLRPWTLKHPKALVPVGGKPMLWRVLNRLSSQGYGRVTVNVHHFAGQIEEYLRGNPVEGIEWGISDERGCLLDTGGGLRRVLEDMEARGEDMEAPMLVHNVDILTDLDLREGHRIISAGGADVVLLTSGRESTRRLIFDGVTRRLRGWHNLKNGEYLPEGFQPEHGGLEEAFSGIYHLRPSAVLAAMRELGMPDAFPLVPFLIKASRRLRIVGDRRESGLILDIGKPDSLNRANEIASEG